MSNPLISILNEWQQQKQQQWVLATVFNTEGHCGCEVGQMMLFCEDGRQLGMPDGGTPNSLIQRHAFDTMGRDKSMTTYYEPNEDADVTSQLDIGHRARVHIVMQPILQANNYLELDKLLAQLQTGQHCTYEIQLPSFGYAKTTNKLLIEDDIAQAKAELVDTDRYTFLHVPFVAYH